MVLTAYQRTSFLGFILFVCHESHRDVAGRKCNFGRKPMMDTFCTIYKVMIQNEVDGEQATGIRGFPFHCRNSTRR